MNTIETDGETQSLTGQELGNDNCAGSSQSTPVTSEEVTRQIKAVTDPLSMQLELVYDLIKKLRKTRLKRYEKTKILIQGSSGAPNHSFDTTFCIIRKLLGKFTIEYQNFSNSVNMHVCVCVCGRGLVTSSAFRPCYQCYRRKNCWLRCRNAIEWALNWNLHFNSVVIFLCKVFFSSCILHFVNLCIKSYRTIWLWTFPQFFSSLFKI